MQKFCSITNHSWDGFWFVAGGKVWKTVPAELQQVITRHINTAAKKQRDDIARANVDLQKALEGKGLTFNKPDTAPFRQALRTAGFYAQARERFDKDAWALLAQYAGDIG